MSSVSESGKKICFVVADLQGGGAERVVITLASTLVDIGHHVDVIMLRNIVDYHIAKTGFRVYSIMKKDGVLSRGNILRRALFIVPRLRKLLRQTRYDIVVSHNPHASLYGRLARVPNLYHCIHTNLSAHYEQTLGTWPNMLDKYKWLYSGQRIITVSQGIKDDVHVLGIKTKSIQVIYNPFNFFEIKRKSLEFDVQEEDYIIAIGRLHIQKRFDMLIEAYIRSNVQQKLLILGKGEERAELERLISNLGMGERIVLKGFVKNPFPYIKKAKALVLSSDYEGLPTVLIEALILDTPVVSTNCPSGPQEILTDELAEFLSPVGDVDALATNIHKVVTKPPGVTEKYYERFNAKYAAEQYVKLCN